MKILDCTLRDGGYYTNWDFDEELVKIYAESIENLPIDYIEVGYRSIKLEGYLGKYFYCPLYVLKQLKEWMPSKKLVIILNEKDIKASDVKELLEPCIPYINMVRIAVDPQNMERAIGLAKEVKKLDFEVAFNVMYMSSWTQDSSFIDLLIGMEDTLDYFYMVDSFGGVLPDEVINLIKIIKSKIDIPLGFHGHNNLEMALSNTLTAIEHNIDIVDATITGMGRGAGNLKMELLLTVLQSQNKIELDYNPLGHVTAVFNKLKEQYDWGTNLPYMVSGANSLPQKNVMEWVSNRFYSFNSIIRALENQSHGLKDNIQLQVLNFDKEKQYQAALIIGGGPNAVNHYSALKVFLENNTDVVVIHASSKNALSYSNISNDQYFCLVGNEGHRLEKVFSFENEIKGKCVLPPYPRKMGTYIPNKMKDNTYELEEIDFTNKYKDSHTALALQTAISLNVSKIYIAGYDGYPASLMGQKEQELFKENEYLFIKVKDCIKHIELISLTPTRYDQLYPLSVYSSIS
ncbi:MAG: aldolase catalytic domain-containing protein [Balneola sp.]|nr:aldolase catalytic domain-containing protein [Balneola sp.]